MSKLALKIDVISLTLLLKESNFKFKMTRCFISQHAHTCICVCCLTLRETVFPEWWRNFGKSVTQVHRYVISSTLRVCDENVIFWIQSYFVTTLYNMAIVFISLSTCNKKSTYSKYGYNGLYNYLNTFSWYDII